MGIGSAWLYLGVGMAVVAGALLPILLKRRRLTAPMAFVAAGLLIGLIPVDGRLNFVPVEHPRVVERLAEITVLIALMGVGLAMPRRLGRRTWRPTWRLLLVAMPPAIAAVALLGWGVAGLTPAAALLLGAALAPTDPVLASDVQVGGPKAALSAAGQEVDDLDDPPRAEPQDPPAEPDDEADSDEVRFALTSEAGFNDGLAFPFVYLAMAFAVHSGWGGGWLGHWLWWTLAGKVLLGLVIGLGMGWLLVRLAFRFPHKELRLSEAGEPIVALGATCAAYGIAEVVGGYGFIAVFATGLGLRTFERTQEYHHHLHDFLGQLEHLLTWLILLALGVAIADGLFAELTWGGAVVGAALVLVIRPVFGWLSVQGTVLGPRERWAAAFFGVRGVGTIYYLAYALGRSEIGQGSQLWAICGFTIVLSVVVHGLTASDAMDRLDSLRRKHKVDAV